MLGLLLNPVVLLLLVWIVAGSPAEFGFGRMFFIALGVGLVGAVLSLLVPGFLGLLTLIPVGALLVFLLMKFYCLTAQQALIVTGLYLTYQILFSVGLALLLK